MEASRKNKLTAIRHQARQLYMESLDSPFSYCGLCGEKLVWLKLLDATVYWRGGYYAEVYFADGHRDTILVGTVDHITKISDGGTNALANLAGLCIPCHRDKDEQVAGERYCRRCMMPLEKNTFERIHWKCQRDEPFLTYKLGEALTDGLRTKLKTAKENNDE